MTAGAPMDGTVVGFVASVVDGAAVLAVSGEVDATTAPDLERALDGLQGGAPRGVVVDLAAVELIDSTGLGVLVSAARRLEAAGAALHLAGPSRLVRRVLAVTGLDHVLTVHDDVAGAVAALP